MKKYLTILCSGLLLCSGALIGLKTNNVHASERPSHFLMVKTVRHARRTNKSHRHVRNTKKAIYRETFKDVNHYRHKYHRKPVHISYRLNHIANTRANQLIHSFSHYNKYEKSNYGILIHRHHIHYKIYGENLGDCTFDYNISGKSMANMTANQMMYHDQASDNGHRANILDRRFHKIGVGVSYNRRTNTYYSVEDFLG